MSQPKQLHLDIKLDESITLDNFISCSSTELVLKATNHFVSNHSSFKTLYLWGKDGVGKNYLLHATNKKCKENNLSSTFLSFSRNTYEDKNILQGLEEPPRVPVATQEILKDDSHAESQSRRGRKVRSAEFGIFPHQ